MIKATTALVTVDGDDGKEHWHIKDWHYTSQVKTNAKFNFDNLFNGNKVLGESLFGLGVLDQFRMKLLQESKMPSYSSCHHKYLFIFIGKRTSHREH